MKRIELPESLTEIGFAAFSGCVSLENITIPEGVTKIGGNAFVGCRSLQSLYLPHAVTEIGDDIIFECQPDISIYCGGEQNPNWSERWNRLYVGKKSASATANFCVPRWWYEKFAK